MKRFGIKILFILFVSVFVFCGMVLAQNQTATKTKLLLVANSILDESTFQFIDQKTGTKYSSPSEVPKDAVLQIESPYNDWRYWNGVLNIAMIELSKDFSDPTYKEFAKRNIEFCFDNYKYFEAQHKNESRWEYPFGQFFMMEELDDCGAMGGSLAQNFPDDKQTRYMDYLNKAANHVLNVQARLEDGTLVRAFPSKWTLWADDLYMGISFLSRMGEMTGDVKYLDDAAKQVVNFHKYLFNQNSGLMYHCYYSDVDRQGVAYWGRANGWALVAQVDLLDRLPAKHPQRKKLIELLQRHVLGISRYQSESGLWHQLLDKTDSFLETSCSAMFTYAIARAVNKGYIEPRYASIAIQGWEGVMTKILPDGKVEGICAGTGTSDNLIHYYKRPTPLNDIHGLGAILLAGMEILHLPK
ncbi:MAG: glycoside hydrolase family 88 protein [bacterium]